MSLNRSIKDLLEKFKDNILSREEFDRLTEMMNDFENKDEIKFWLGEYWWDLGDFGEDFPTT